MKQGGARRLPGRSEICTVVDKIDHLGPGLHNGRHRRVAKARPHQLDELQMWGNQLFDESDTIFDESDTINDT